jgi:prepilin-type processing-associated H-X9-DG protein
MEFVYDDADADVAVWLDAEETQAWVDDADTQADLRTMILEELPDRAHQSTVIVYFADGSVAATISAPEPLP